MSLQDIDDNIKKLLELQEAKDKEASNNQKKKKWKPFRLPGKVKSKAKKETKAGKVLGIILKNNKTIDFMWLEEFGGIVQTGEYKFNMFEEGAVYIHNFKIPTIVIPEWRLMPVGGIVEDAEKQGYINIPSKLFGGQSDILISQALNLGADAEQTIIRAIEKKEADMSTKKKGNWGWLIWLAVGLIGLYVLAKIMGWM